MAVKHGLVGWVKNTDKSRGTVVGVVQGAESQVELMKTWLRETGSPRSHIDRCEFSKEGPVTRTQYHSFTIKR
ncbi:Acylphosphatase-2 [Geodia barretti]|nr:Acylphosphatase-2 [Geodia barretti]